MKTGAQTHNCFQSDAAKYAAYLESPEGRLRLDLTFANLQEFLPDAKTSLRALDLGCGTGVTAIRLAQMGIHVTLLDCSTAMLSIAERAALESGVVERVALNHSDATQLENSFPSASFDLILCHNVLEYVDDPDAVLHDVARLLRDSSSIISVLVRNQAGEAIKTAIQAGDLASAQDVLSSEWTRESLYGGRVRLFTPEKVRTMVQAQSFRVIAERGVRVIADYLPAQMRKEEYEGIFEFERKLGRRAELVGVARYFHCLTSPVPTEDRA